MSASQIYKNELSSTYYPQTSLQVEQYNWNLTALPCFYVSDNQQSWDSYAYTFTDAYNSKINSYTNTRPFELLLNQWILNMVLESTVFSGKMLTAAKQRARLLATKHPTIDCARISLQRAQEN